jgi:transposase
MLGRPFRIAWRDDEPVLRQAYKREREAELRPRLHALWLLRRGERLGAVADLVGVHYRTVQQWVAWYRRGGLAEVRRHRNGGRQGAPSRLSPVQRQLLVERAAADGFATIGEARAWAEQQFGVRYAYGGMRSLFHRLRLSWKVPRPLAQQASLSAQAAWKRGASPRR